MERGDRRRVSYETRVRKVREFNRFYTERIGVLSPRFLSSSFSLTEVRILFELAHGSGVTAKELSQSLGLDPGYISRTLSGMETQGLIRREPSAEDGRRRPISLTPRGRKTFATLDRRQSREVRAMLGALSPAQQERLLAAMATVQELLE